MDIFDPLIDLLERGWKFYFGDGGINVPGTAYWPLHGWFNRALKSGFRLYVKDLQWINGEEDDPEDLCCHGHVTAVIGGHILERTANVSASALCFLKTLTENHIMNEVQLYGLARYRQNHECEARQTRSGWILGVSVFGTFEGIRVLFEK